MGGIDGELLVPGQNTGLPDSPDAMRCGAAFQPRSGHTGLTGRRKCVTCIRMQHSVMTARICSCGW